MIKAKLKRRDKLARVYFLILLAFTLLFTQVGACSSDNGNDLYGQYNLFCDIVDEEYAKYQKSDKSANAKFALITGIDEQVGKRISNDQVKQTYKMLRDIGGDNPYELLRHDVKSRTGKEFKCEAYKALTQLNSETQ
ncbi:MAG: hypothetical protein AMJ53_10060 [Gammaproteobacteria bacterium SG8_11]|nr:MAG: hypothetical protein AMJ53_10060 [Gammaproteobacteria bacterium SG8_11]